MMLVRPPSARRRVLVADDDRAIRELLTMNLEAQGLDVLSCRDGDTAAALARSVAPDLIVIDVMVPGRDGFDVLAALKNHPITKEIPVVIVSAQATDHDMEVGRRLGASAYVAKPFDLEDLLDHLDAVLTPASPT